MIRIVHIAVVLVLTSCSSPAVRVVDGDTVEIGGETVRIHNIDTPEIGQAKCDAEKARGLKAKERLEELLNSGTIELQRGDGKRMTDRYGRTLGRVSLNGRDVGEILIEEGHARRWNGKRRPWC